MDYWTLHRNGYTSWICACKRWPLHMDWILYSDRRKLIMFWQVLYIIQTHVIKNVNTQLKKQLFSNVYWLVNDEFFSFCLVANNHNYEITWEKKTVKWKKKKSLKRIWLYAIRMGNFSPVHLLIAREEGYR